ncbi:SRP72 RNA-binding domain-containing protein [Toxoplasma gondii GT1]|uniref:Signal recognition particle subunit SRP72 n=4 Tax=Toxoplasma gondii TaxID=5811 RepID=S7UNG8_TOXGG|nr:SRP72 RNA-binding domain-containing protein [Toxoplasma gondii GT1]KAF4645487.1 SRP72 RNA-binding domain-containing protein [Toxoplasma gondii]KFG37246.1 SRP72 RNA-binding domain-containing protein [Toxoplasma gondii FOU]
MAAEAGKKKSEPLSPDEVTDLFRRLDDLLRQENYEQALKVCSKLSLDEDSGRSRLFCLLQLGRWSAATELVKTLKKIKVEEEGAEAAARAYLFEEAYCLYRLNRPQKALELLEKNARIVDALPPEERLRVTHLKAQTLHRLGSYGACRAIYEELLQDDLDNEALLVNFLSATVCCGETHATRDSLVPAKLWRHVERNLGTTYELPFNAACVRLLEGRLDDADVLLQQARELCAEECGIEEEALNQGDLAGVLVQEAFLRDLQGRGEEASALYSRLLQKVAEERTAGEGPEEVDVAVLTVAQTNAFVHDARRRLTETGERSEDSSFARSGGCTLDDAIKRLARGTGQALDQKLTTAQALTLAVNRCVAFILAGRLEEARRLLAASSARFGPRQPKLILLRAALQLASGRPAKAEEQLRHLLSSSSPSSPSVSLPPAEEIRVHLALAALRLEQGDSAGASSVLGAARARLQSMSEDCPEKSAATDRLSLLRDLVAMQQRAGDAEGAIQSLEAEQTAWKDKSSGDSGARFAVSVLLTSASACAALGHWAAAGQKCREVLAQTQATSPEYLRALVGAVHASSFSSSSEQDAKFLRELRQRIPQRILLLDSDEVEKQDVTACAPRKTKESRPSAGDAEAEKKKKKKRKPRWPKGFDPNEPHLPPDPERWLPKCERTGYKKMLRRRKEAGRGGAQGAVAPGTAEATTGFRNAGPSTAKTEAAKDKNVGSRKKRGTRK